jgi:anti-anti-sigma regulatory factor
MNMTVENVPGDVPVTVLRLEGELDGSNYQQLIDRVEALYEEGSRRLLLDLRHLTYLSSAGLVALHSIALTMRGEKPADPETGWGAFRAIHNDLDSHPSPEANLKMLGPQPRVARTLEMSGFSRLISILPDEERALASFT